MNKELKNWLILIFLACIWGSSFVLMKRGMTDKITGESVFSSEQVASLRMLLASTVLLPIAVRHFRIVSSFKIFTSLLAVAFLGNFFPAFLFTYAETGISSGYAGMLNSCTPIFTLIIGALFFRQKLLKLQVIGVLLGTVGIVGLVNGVQTVDTSGSWQHVIAVVTATLFYGTAVNTIKYNLSHIKPYKMTSVAFSFSFIPALGLFLYFDTPATISGNEHAGEALLYIGILGVIGTALAVLVFNYLITRSSALFASSVTYFIPIVAVIIGFADGESISWLQVVSMIVILGGVFIANVWAKIGKKRINT
ncbi:MAG: DMT family transporter [Brumimicrobium sp.]|nr:DMT family transporter [Brumimicrobium sp.]